MRKQSAKNVLMNDGTGCRVPGDQADALITGKKAKRFISNTIYRALKLGIEVKNYGDQDTKRALRSQIQDLRTKKRSAAHKAEQKRKKKEQEQEDASK